MANQEALSARVERFMRDKRTERIVHKLSDKAWKRRREGGTFVQIKIEDVDTLMTALNKARA